MRIIVISCSNLKRPFSIPTPAESVYDGPYYKTIRKLKREGHFPRDVRVVITSAEHGLLCLEDEILPYDRKICKERCNELHRATIVKLAKMIVKLGCDELVINLGSDYLPLVSGIEKEIPQTCKVEYLRGTIIQRRKQLKEYLLDGNCTA